MSEIPVALPLDLEAAVRQRYGDAAQAREAALCCPVSYDAKLLEAIPAEVIERDYGCGDPSKHLRAGETVLDLGSGTGKICFMAAQLVGPTGRVIGVDMNPDMLALARGAAPEVARRIGYANTEFRKGKIQDLLLDRDAVDAWLRAHPVGSEHDLVALEAATEELRQSRPLIADGSIDVVVSNCVLNLVTQADKGQMFRELHRVLKRGGRVVISDIVSDEDIPAELQRDPELWSGCISGAFREDAFLEAFEAAGFYGVTVLERGEQPWRTVNGIEFRSVTVAAYKGKEGACLDQKHAVIYRGPWRQVQDDDGHVLRRGVRTAVCEKTFGIYAREPYRAHLDLVQPYVQVPLGEAPPFPCNVGPLRRDPRETKGGDYQLTSEAGPVCKPGACC
ncbi:MAG: methyltransferase domain-containing protein [Kofleriaceae bacterium]